MIAEGKITVDLGPDGAVRLVSNRTASVAALLNGRSADEALELLPLVFSLCAKAHVCAARCAMGLTVRREDALLVLAENAREHLLRIILGWKVDDDAIQMPTALVMGLVGDMETSCPDQVADALDAYLETHVLAMALRDFLNITTLGQLGDWLYGASTPAKRYLIAITLENGQALGATQPRYLPDLPMNAMLARLADPQFCLTPDWLGTPRETGPLARQNRHPLIAEVLEVFGAGLLARLLARLVDLAQIPARMRAGAEKPVGQSGMGVVETARGRLIHACRIRDGKIADYTILAPTEWNFHLGGVAVQSLGALRAPDKTTLARHARAILEAIDPCVDFELRVA